MAAVTDRLLAPVAVVAPDSTLLYINPAAAHAVGADAAWLLGRRMLELVHPEDRERVERGLGAVASGRPTGALTTYRIRAHAAAPWLFFESIADNLLDDPTIAGILVSSRDVTERVNQQMALRVAAYRDPLTRLPNRAQITDELLAAMRDEQAVAVALVGLDRFKVVNDSLGHSAGDHALVTVAARIVDALPPGAVAGRYEGDVFAIVLTGPLAGEAAPLLWRVVERIGEAVFVAGHELRLSSSVGLAERSAAATAESLCRDAGAALHRAKLAGGGCVEQFRGHMRDEALARLELEADLRHAIAREGLALALQPIVRLHDRVAVRAEALARWDRAGDAVAPARFIEIAEETGLIVPLGDWILRRAVELADRAPGGSVSVNLSARQLASPRLPERIARALSAHRVAPARVGFEITESVLVDKFDQAVGVLHAIRDLGCAVGLDDFGTGYSSLSYLRRLPIDFIKIDRTLTADVDADRQGRAVIDAVVTLADALGLDVIAEGVETETQAAHLLDLGCTFGQGYLFGRPTDGR